MDLLATLGASGITFPAAIGTSIVTFALYSPAVLREQTTILRIAGIALGCAGVALLSL